jgi:hypothetical protein
MDRHVVTVQHRQRVNQFDLVGTADILPVQHVALHRLRDPHQGEMDMGGHSVLSPRGIGDRADNLAALDRPADIDLPMQYNMGIDRQKSMAIIDPMVDEHGLAEEIAAKGKDLPRGHDRNGNAGGQILFSSGGIGKVADINALMRGWPDPAVGPPLVTAAEQHSRIEIETPRSCEAFVDRFKECKIGDRGYKRDMHQWPAAGALHGVSGNSQVCRCVVVLPLALDHVGLIASNKMMLPA